jgi:hypothetical protein
MRPPRLGRFGWFVAYWALGVSSLAVVGLLIRAALA